MIAEHFPNALDLLLGSDGPNRQGDIQSLSLTKTVQDEANCPDCFEMGLKAHIYLISRKYQTMLTQWKSAGYPDLGAWPDLDTDLFLVSYLRMAQAVAKSYVR